MSFTVEANVGGFIEPPAAFDLDGLEGRDFQAAEEILLHVPNTVLDPPFFISLPDITGHGLEPVMSGKVQVAWIEQGLLTAGMAHDAHLQIVDHDLEGRSAKELQGMAVAA